MSNINKILKVKFCYTEEELNDFLKNFPVEELEFANQKKEVTKLYRITYLPNQDYKGSSIRFKFKMGITSIVEYWSFELNKEGNKV